MDIQSFVTNHGTFAIVLLIIVVVYIGCTLYWLYASKSKSPFPFSSSSSSSSKSHGCLNKQTQEKIADEIQRKLKEIDSCDCKDACKLKSPNKRHLPLALESPSTTSSESSESIKTESFGNDDFY